MKIVVCIKPVKAELVYPNEKRNEKFLMNPYDLYALEKCISYKKETGAQIICLCMGPASAAEVLIKAHAMGTDDEILLSDSRFSGSDTVATTYILSKAIEKIGDVDLVMCGEKAVDGETGQIGAGLSERLSYSFVLDVASIDASNNPDTIIVTKSEENLLIKGEQKFPAVIAFQDFVVAQPNISLMALKRAKKKEITVWDADQINAQEEYCGFNGSKTKVLEVKNEVVKKKQTILTGTISEKTAVIIQAIQGRIESEEQ